MSNYCPPVLLLAFRRPKETELSFASIREARPKQLFVAIDGPRRSHPDDKERIAQVKLITQRVDWDCQVKYLYHKSNLGLEKAIPQALNWFFEQVECGVVIEDDCILDQSFYNFAALMLKKYIDDPSIMVVNASNFLPPAYYNRDKYYLSQYPHFWGWASWARAWKLYEGSMTEWPSIKSNDAFARYYHSIWDRSYFETIFEATYRGRTNSWGYRWFYSVWKNKGVCITPGVNLSTNIGFNRDGTHPVIRKFVLKAIAISDNPTPVSQSIMVKYDRLTARRYYGISPIMIMAQKIFYSLKATYAKYFYKN